MEARFLRPEDGRAYAALRAQQAAERAARSAWSELGTELKQLAQGADETIRHYLMTGTAVWGAFDGPSLVGALAVSPRYAVRAGHYLWLWGLFVRPPYRGTPASRRLMEAALAWCEAQSSPRRLFGAFDPDNLQALRFCERYGFVPADVTAKTLGQWSLADGVMVEFLR